MKLKHTQLQIFLEIAGSALLAATVLFLVLGWNSFPQRIPMHFNAEGAATSWGDKGDLLFIPVLGMILYAVMTILTFFPAVWNMSIGYKEENKIAVYQAIKTMMMVLKAEMLGIFLYITYFMASAQDMPGYFLPVVLVAIFVPILLFILHARKAGKQDGNY
jgi:Protein of unknown function (DUF1648).